MIVLPSLVKEYSKALALDLVARRVINPADSRLRKVLVSIASGHVSNVAAQLPVPVRPFFQREEDLRCPSADKDRVLLFDPYGIVVARAVSLSSRYNPVLCAHEINLAWNVEMTGVTSVAGFQSQHRPGSTWTP
jgi:hypothetical protein